MIWRSAGGSGVAVSSTDARREGTKMLMQDAETRRALWDRLAAAIEKYLDEVGEARVAPDLDAGDMGTMAAIREALAPFDFERPVAPAAALDFAVDGLWRWQVHTPHPRYFGLFNP